MTPIQVTVISAGLTFAGIVTSAMVSPAPSVAAAVCLLLVFGYALDAADGQLARLRGGGSIAGEWLDHVVDAAKIASLHLAVLMS
jgi:phosphatidylglycerophosphate synthase